MKFLSFLFSIISCVSNIHSIPQIISKISNNKNVTQNIRHQKNKTGNKIFNNKIIELCGDKPFKDNLKAYAKRYFIGSSNSGWISREYNFLIDINKFIGEYIIGDFNKYLLNKDILIKINNETIRNAIWQTNISNSKYNLGLFINKTVQNSKEKYFTINKDANFSFNEIFDKNKKFEVGEMTDEDGGWIQACDEAKIRVNTKVKYNSTRKILEFTLMASVYTEDDWSPQTKDYVESELIVNSPTQLNYDSIMPYSSYDINLFKETFKNILCKPIRIKNAKNPIIFDYKNSSNEITENEKYVLSELEARKELFWQNNEILNKLGNVVERDTKTNKYINTNDVEIDIDIPSSIRGKRGSQKINVVFQLKNDRKFFFTNDKSESRILFEVPIYLELDPKVDLNINDSISILPYKSASNDSRSYYMEKNNNPKILGSNNPKPYLINDFTINLNKKNKVGQYELIDIQKMPIISKLGTVIKCKILIKINDVFIEKEINFERLFNNGSMLAEINLSETDYKNSKIRFKSNIIKLKLSINNDKILLSNINKLELIDLDSSNENIIKSDVSINILETTAYIPSEQLTKPSKWKQIEDSKFYEEKKLQYVGTFETFDPFIFRFESIKIQITDPITNEFIGYASRYKPYIRKGKFNQSNSQKSKDEPVFPSVETDDSTSIYESNLGTYLMKNKTENGKLDFQIVIKEFDKNLNNSNLDDRYTMDRWIIGISMNLISSQSSFIMSGYKDNELIKQENEQKYFNQESPYYRGDYINKETGMYYPKIVWVNSIPPESFLYDPLDASGNKIVKQTGTNDEIEESIKRAKYDIGYIAELNATGFSSGDYNSLPTFGGYETFFNVDEFKPNGNVPYSEFYTYNKNSIEPIIERTPLSQSGLQTIKSTSNFRQIVLKKDGSGTYLYQFVKIANNSKDIVNNKNVIDLYGNLKGYNDKPLFVDFWETYQGKHLMDYLTKEYKIFQNEEDVKKLKYSDVMQYWNIYVNDPKHYGNSNNSISTFDISKLQPYFNNFAISCGQLEELRRTIINRLEEMLTNVLIKNGYINSDEISHLIYDRHFFIEDSKDIFEKKLNDLIINYSLPLNEARFIDFKITINDDFFKNFMVKPTGSIFVNVLNNKNADLIIDLNQYNGSKLSINTSLPYFKQSKNMISRIKEVIYNSINNDFHRIFNNSSIIEDNYIPVLDKDYVLKFYTTFYDEYGIMQKYYYPSLERAIKDVLLYETNKNVFYNTLFIEVEACFNDNSHFMINSFEKMIVNNSRQEEAIVDTNPFDISCIKANDIKINSESKDFVFEENQTKQEKILEIIENRVINDIFFWAKKWIQTNNLQPKIDIDYQIIFIKDFDSEQRPIYYDNQKYQDKLGIIENVLLSNIQNDQNFNRDLFFEIRAIQGGNLEGKFIKKINNNFLNKGIEDDILGDVNIDDEINGNGDETSNILLENKKGNNDNFNWWWVVTPVTIFIILVISLCTILIIRKNRKIR